VDAHISSREQTLVSVYPSRAESLEDIDIKLLASFWSATISSQLSEPMRLKMQGSFGGFSVPYRQVKSISLPDDPATECIGKPKRLGFLLS